MILFPSAKINIGLSILDKREDGYHNLESVFLPVPLIDSLEFIESTQFSFEASIEINAEKPNSIIQAYTLLSKQFDLPPISIYLHKVIPMGAGLGGGSANGAFMLVGLNDYFDLGLTNNELEKYAANIGSDCPFFIENTPKLVHGRGEILNPIELSLAGYKLVLINPNIHVSTQQAFQHLSLKTDPRTSIENIILTEPIEQWKSLVFNDFEESIFNQFPAIQTIKNELYQQGALYASMTGTGSTVYGIFDQEIELSGFPEDYFKTICNF